MGLAEDSGSNPDVFKKSNEVCHGLKKMLESANQLPGMVSDLLWSPATPADARALNAVVLQQCSPSIMLPPYHT